MSEKETRFTKGPWFLFNKNKTICILGADKDHHRPVVHWAGFDDVGRTPTREKIANARLATAAPEMFECLINARALWGHRSTDAPQMKWLEEVDVALSKALGETP